MRVLRVFFTCLVLVLLTSAVLPVVAQEQPYFPATEWRTSSPEAQGIESAKLAAFVDSMSRETDAFHSMVLIRHGYKVLDVSLSPFSSSRPQAFRDSSDPIIATLIEIAIEQGYIEGLDQSIWDFLPSDKTANMDASKAALTIGDFLTHRSGLDFPEGEDFEEYYPLGGTDQSWLQVFLDAKMAATPGTELKWFFGDGLVLSAILQQATGMTTLDFARQTLFGPLGISDVTWLSTPQGITIGLDEIYLSPQDMARIAYLYARDGQWQGKQVVSGAWVKAATSNIVIFPPGTSSILDAAGYGWSVVGDGPDRQFLQLTAGGEQFGVVPQLDLIFVVTGDTTVTLTEGGALHALLSGIGETPTLPENPAALALLNEKIGELENPAARSPGALPEVLKAASGKTFALDENPTGWQTLAVDFGASGSTEGTLTLRIGDRTIQLATGFDSIDRITPVGLPAQPGSAAYRLFGDLPWKARANWTEKELNVWIGDLMGRESWFIALRFAGGNRIRVDATMSGLHWTPDTWTFYGRAG